MGLDYAEVRAEIERRSAAYRARLEAERVAAQRIQQRRLRRLAALVREIARDAGGSSVVGRLDAGGDDEVPLGLLPEEEALQLVRDARLPRELEGPIPPDVGGVGVPWRIAPYAKLTRREAHGECQEPYDEGCETAIRVVPVVPPVTLSREEWEELRAVRAVLEAVLPGAELHERLHLGYCACLDHDDVGAAAARRVGLLARLDLGDGLVVEREYGAPR